MEHHEPTAVLDIYAAVVDQAPEAYANHDRRAALASFFGVHPNRVVQWCIAFHFWAKKA